ncbi:MAG: TfoX/Sxy family protein [Phaeodactylibacter sp.]|nr:TfoX/Sxy family protein [Phaeodactylibacter sp.]
MAVDQSFVDYMLDQLSEIPDVTAKKMFGGVGFFINGKMFGAVMPNETAFRLKVKDSNRAAYEAAGMEDYTHPTSNRKMPYYTVPEEIVADPHKLAEWAQLSIAIALEQ